MYRKLACFAAVLLFASVAQAAGLAQATGVLQMLLSSLKTIIPVVATIALIICGVFYAMRMMHKDTFVHWFVGIIIAGSAVEIVALLGV